MSKGEHAGDWIEFVGQVAKLTTLADKGLRVTLDLPEDALEAWAWLTLARQDDIAVRVTVEAA